MAAPLVQVSPPPLTPRPYRLLSTALVLDDLEGHAQAGVRYDAPYCGPAFSGPGPCVTDPFGDATLIVSATGAGEVAPGAVLPGSVWSVWINIPIDQTPTQMVEGDGSIMFTVTEAGPLSVIVRDDVRGYYVSFLVDVAENPDTPGEFIPINVDSQAGWLANTVEGFPQEIGVPFEVYSEFECNHIGITDAEMSERAGRSLAYGESRTVEATIGRVLATREGVALVGAGPASAVRVLTALEAYAAEQYGGTPMLHMSAAAAVQFDAAHLLHVTPTGVLLTVNGSQVTIGGGYGQLPAPTGVAGQMEGAAWVYISGQVVLHRSTVTVSEPLMSRTPATNKAMSRASRMYAATVECFSAGSLLDLDLP